jgi:hypothetical protein
LRVLPLPIILVILFSLQSSTAQDQQQPANPPQQGQQQGAKQEDKKDAQSEISPPSKREIDAAIMKGVEWLLKQQKPDGSFDGIYSGSYGMGNTALCLLALLKCGVRRDHPSIRKGFDYALKLPFTHVYSVSIMIMAIEAYYELTDDELEKVGKSLRTNPAEVAAKRVEPAMRKWVSDAVEWLISKQQANIWRYPEGGEDVSNTQYALLALNAAMRMKIQVPPSVFKKAADYFLKYQGESKEEFKPIFRVPAADFSIAQLRQMEKDYYKRLTGESKSTKKDDDKEKPSSEDAKKPRTELAEDPYRRFGVEEANFKMYPRGWQYTAPAPYKVQGVEKPAPPVRGSGSMTTAGLTSIIICKAGLEGTGFWTKEYAALVNQSIRDGAAWLAKYFSVSGNPYEGTAQPSSSYHYYYLYGLERAGVLALVKFFGTHDWYVEGARFILKEQKPEGWWGQSIRTIKVQNTEQKQLDPSDTCFALLFLKRATTPIVAVPDEAIYSGEGVLKKPEEKKPAEQKPAEQNPPTPPAPQQGWKIGVSVEHTLLGVTVKQVLDGYPAKDAGLKEGDVIDSVEGKEIHTVEEFQSAISQATTSKNEIQVVVKRGAEKIETIIKKK